MLLLDFSSNNPTPNFGKLKAAGVDGVWLKATEGAAYYPSWDVYTEWAARARGAGLRVGAYHFARPNGPDAQLEAANFAATINRAGGIDRRDLRPVLDMERNDGKLTPAALTQWCRDFNRVVSTTTGTLPLFYSYPAFILETLKPAYPIGAGLWLASYGPNDGQEHPYDVPTPWKRAVAHQFTSLGHIDGAAGVVDMSSAAKLRPLLAHPILGLL